MLCLSPKLLTAHRITDLASSFALCAALKIQLCVTAYPQNSGPSDGVYTCNNGALDAPSSPLTCVKLCTEVDCTAYTDSANNAYQNLSSINAATTSCSGGSDCKDTCCAPSMDDCWSKAYFICCLRTVS
jgi:hypothetical protein